MFYVFTAKMAGVHHQGNPCTLTLQMVHPKPTYAEVLQNNSLN